MKLIILLDGISIPNTVINEAMANARKLDSSDRINEVIIHGPGRYDSEFIVRLKRIFVGADFTYRTAYVGNYRDHHTRWRELVNDDIRQFDLHQYFAVIVAVTYPHSLWFAQGHSSNYTEHAYLIGASGIHREQLNFSRLRIPSDQWNR